jgi:hypothetical protein
MKTLEQVVKKTLSLKGLYVVVGPGAEWLAGFVTTDDELGGSCDEATTTQLIGEAWVFDKKGATREAKHAGEGYAAKPVSELAGIEFSMAKSGKISFVAIREGDDHAPDVKTFAKSVVGDLKADIKAAMGQFKIEDKVYATYCKNADKEYACRKKDLESDLARFAIQLIQAQALATGKPAAPKVTNKKKKAISKKKAASKPAKKRK